MLNILCSDEGCRRLTCPPEGTAPLHTVQLLGSQMNLSRLRVAAGRAGGGGGGGCRPSGASRRGRGCGGRYGEGNMGLGGHCWLVYVLGCELEVRDGLHQLGLGLLQQAVDVLGAELGQTGSLLFPVPLRRLTQIQIQANIMQNTSRHNWDGVCLLIMEGQME